jgi:hypothetical protein
VAQQRTANNQGAATATITSAPVAAGACITPGLGTVLTTHADDSSAKITLPFAFTYQGGRLALGGGWRVTGAQVLGEAGGGGH